MTRAIKYTAISRHISQKRCHKYCMNWYTHMHICVHSNMSGSWMHKHTTCTSFAHSHSIMQYDTWGVVYITVQRCTLFKSKSLELWSVQKSTIHLKMGHPHCCIKSHMYVYSIINHTQQATCKHTLATTFCSKSEPPSVHFTKTEKTEALYNIRMAVSPFSL